MKATTPMAANPPTKMMPPAPHVKIHTVVKMEAIATLAPAAIVIAPTVAATALPV